jgi:lysophospholipase L1-like esterase
MKKIISLVGLIFMLSGCAKVEIANINSKGKNIICFGDSLTEGFGADPKSAYPAVLGQLISVPVINAGIEGDTSSEALKRLQSDVLGKEPRLVIIEFGANDFLTNMPLEQTVKNMEEIISRCHAQGAMVAIADIGSIDQFLPYSRRFKTLSQSYKTIFIPDILNGIITNPDMKSSDSFHPNSSGYKMIAHYVYRAILPFLNQNALLNKFKK